MDIIQNTCKNGSQKPRALVATPMGLLQETGPRAQHFCHNQMRGKTLPDTKVSKPWPPTPAPEGRGIGSRIWGLKMGRGSQDNQGAARGLERDLHPRESPVDRGCGDKSRTKALRKPSKKTEQLLILQKRNV